MGSFEPNEYGLYDLSGNVYEWREDWVDSTKEMRVLRGGSWSNYERGSLLSSCRQRAVKVKPKSTPSRAKIRSLTLAATSFRVAKRE